MTMVRIGTMAVRGPDGSVVNSVGLYEDQDDATIAKNAESINIDFARIFADKMRQYKEAQNGENESTGR